MNIRSTLRISALMVVAAGTVDAADTAIDLRDGAVYLMTNQPTNAVIAFDRAPNGALTRVGRFLTGGHGNPAPQGSDPPIDPLASQGSLMLSQDHRFLFAANAGSHEISVFAVRADTLQLIDKQPSGGQRPISIATSGKLLYALNEGGTPNFTGFNIGPFGQLSPLAGSTRSLPGGFTADPAQLSFNLNGKLLVVTEKLSNLIAVFPVGSDGLTRAPSITPSHGLTPFGFGFDGRGHLIVSEAAGGLPGESSVSSYGMLPGDVLDVISGSIPDHQTAACWIVISGDARFAYVSNAGSGEVSSYRISADGRLSLLDATASDTGDTSGPIDMALTGDGTLLYVHQAGRQAIAVFHVENDGTLARRPGITGLPFAAQGIAAY